MACSVTCSGITATALDHVPANWEGYACYEAPPIEAHAAEQPSHFRCACGAQLSTLASESDIRLHEATLSHKSRLPHLRPAQPNDTSQPHIDTLFPPAPLASPSIASSPYGMEHKQGSGVGLDADGDANGDGRGMGE